MGENRSFESRIREFVQAGTQTLRQYKQLKIHRCQAACFCTKYQQFLSVLSNANCKKDVPTPHEEMLIKQLFDLNSKIYSTFVSYDQEHYVNSIIQYPFSYFEENVKAFEDGVSDVSEKLRLTVHSPFTLDEKQNEIDEAADIDGCIQIVQRIITHGISPSLMDRIKQRLEELSGLQQKYACLAESPLQSHITEDEISKGLLKFKNFFCSIEDFSIENLIGKGGFSEVYKGVHKQTSKVVAIKKLTTTRIDQTLYGCILREIEIFTKLNHFAILPFIGLSEKPPFIIVSEYMPGGNLFDRLSSKTKPLTPTKKTIIALGIALGMQHMHDKGFIHRDLKTLNVLLTADDYPQICDFGISREVSDTMTGNIGTPNWMAPEVIECKPYGTKADVFSYGIMLWEMLTCQKPYRGLKNHQVCMKVASGELRPLIPPNTNPDIAKFLNECWDQDPDKRPTFATIAQRIVEGKFSYPGTKMEQVLAYNQKCQQDSQIDRPKESPSKENALLMLGHLSIHSIRVIRNLFNDDAWKPFLTIPETMVSIRDFCSSTNVCQIANELIEIFALLIDFFDDKTYEICVDLFLRFGTVSMRAFLVIVERLIERPYKASDLFMTKFYSFLQAPSIETQIKATNLCRRLIQSVENTQIKFDLLQALCINISSKTDEQLLMQSILCLENLLQNPEIEQQFVQTAKIPLLFDIFTNLPNHEAAKISLSLVTHILKRFKDTVYVARDVLGYISNESTDFQSPGMDQFLAVLFAVSETRSMIELFNTRGSNSMNLVYQLKELMHLESVTIQVLVLKIIFVFVSISTLTALFGSLVREVVGLLNSSISQIVLLASSILTFIFPKVFDPQLLNSDFEAYMQKSLENENALTESALRLGGILCFLDGGAEFLLKSHKIGLIANLMQSNSPTIRGLAIKVLASFASAMPLSEVSLQLVSDFIELLNSPEHSRLAVKFLSCISIHPSAAIKCASQFETLLNILGTSNESTIVSILQTIGSVVSSTEAAVIIQGSSIEKFFILSETFLANKKLEESAIHAIDSMTTFQLGRDLISQTPIPTILKKLFNRLRLSDPLRLVCLRILARAGYTQ